MRKNAECRVQNAELIKPIICGLTCKRWVKIVGDDALGILKKLYTVNFFSE